MVEASSGSAVINGTAILRGFMTAIIRADGMLHM